MPRRFSAEFKFEVTRQLRTGEKRLAQLCREHDLDPSMVRDWKARVEKRGEQAFPRSFGDGSGDDPKASELAAAQARIGELERLVGQQALELEFLKKVFRSSGAPLPKGVRS